MERINGYSSFVLIVKDIDRTQLELNLDRFQSIVDKVREYKLDYDNDRHYIVIQLDVMYSGRSGEELCKFVHSYFPCVAMKQESSTTIIVNDSNDFRALLENAYKDKGKYYFVYDMLSVSERYLACMYAGWEPEFSYETRITHYENGNMYSLMFNEDCIYLFNEDPEIMLTDDYSGAVEEVDMLEGLGGFTIHIAIIQKNLEKTGQNIL